MITRNNIFYVDCDEVLRQLLDKMLELYNANFTPKKTREEITDFVVENSFSELLKQGISPSKWFFEDNSEALFLNALPFSNIAEDIKTLREYGKVYILTYQKGVKNKTLTLQWLEKYGIEYDGILFTKDKTLVNGDYVIDDNDWNLIGTNTRNAILVDAPYNKDTDIKNIISHSSCESVTRVESFHEFVTRYAEAFERLEDIKKRYYKKPVIVDGTEAAYLSNCYIKGLDAHVVFKFSNNWADRTIPVNEVYSRVKIV